MGWYWRKIFKETITFLCQGIILERKLRYHWLAQFLYTPLITYLLKRHLWIFSSYLRSFYHKKSKKAEQIEELQGTGAGGDGGVFINVLLKITNCMHIVLYICVFFKTCHLMWVVMQSLKMVIVVENIKDLLLIPSLKTCSSDYEQVTLKTRRKSSSSSVY